MGNELDNYIVPMALELNKKIEEDVYFLQMPQILKGKLLHLEEMNKKGQNYYLSLKPLKKLFLMYLPGITDMKSVSAHTDDSRWLLSVSPIDVELVVKLLRIWLETSYITNEDIKNENVKKYAAEIVEWLDVKAFVACDRMERLVLLEDGEVKDPDAYSLVPLFVINHMIGTEVIVSGESATWMYAGKREIATDPLHYRDAKEEDFFSYVASFSIQTTPPWNKPYLNVKVTSRRWISKNKSGKVPFYKDKKSVYFRVDDHKLQAFQAQYNGKEKAVTWIEPDRKVFETLYGSTEMVQFEDIICNPNLYLRGMNYVDYYIPFEYGMKDGKRKMHNQDAGISSMDRREIFSDIVLKLENYGDQAKKAQKKENNRTIVKQFFSADLSFLEEDNMREEFCAEIKALFDGQPATIEICYSSGQELLRNALEEKATDHFAGTNVEIKFVRVDNLVKNLSCDDPKKRESLAGQECRMREVLEQLGMALTPTISIVIIHEPEYYKLNDRQDKRVDPKEALRIGFARTGRLTQFVMEEAYRESEKKRLKDIESGRAINKDGSIRESDCMNMNVKSTLLDAYRQLGIHNIPVESEKKTMLGSKIAVGIYVVHGKKLRNDIVLKPFPMMISCDLKNHRILVETELKIKQKYQQEEWIEKICCEYREFPIIFQKLLEELECRKCIEASENFLMNWFEDLETDQQYEIIIEADADSRMFIEGITNKKIREVYDASRGVPEMSLHRKNSYPLKLTDYKNVDFLRIRTNDEVPDYLLQADDEEQVFKESAGVYQFEQLYYSKETRRQNEYKNTKQDMTKLNHNGALSHRNIIEIYPMHLADPEKELDCICDVHNLRAVSIQYKAGRTVLPLPLHLAKLLEEYML